MFISVINMDKEILERVAQATEGFSGREISKLVIAWQAAAYGTANALLTAEVALEVLEESKQSKLKKQIWLNNDQVDRLTTDNSSRMK